MTSIPLLLPGQPEALWFQGENISTFLERYNDLYNNYKVFKEIKRERIIHYIYSQYKNTITIIPEYTKIDYNKNKFYKTLKEEYKNNNWKIFYFNQEFLEQTIKKTKSNRLTFKIYINLFNRISKVLINQGELNKI